MTKHETVSGYMASLPSALQAKLEELRRVILETVPEAEETISYQMPTFKLHGTALVYFAAWKHHIGLYPIPRFDEALEDEVSHYRAAKDTLRFPLGQPLPYELVGRVVAELLRRRLDKRS